MNLLKGINKDAEEGRKKIAVLIDPDKYDDQKLTQITDLSVRCKVDYIFAGGSILFSSIYNCIRKIKDLCSIPVIIFPGNFMQVCDDADGILFLSLISGRNPEFLIGHHVLAAPSLKKSGIEVLPAAYIIIENGKTTSVEYMSNTLPIPADKTEIAVATAIAGEMLGLRLCYLEAGSGAVNSVGLNMITEVKKNISVPLIVGVCFRYLVEALNFFKAGADIIVIGNILEEDPEKIESIALARAT
jgi:putative glycerol-1-phosphate prenyltransferase